MNETKINLRNIDDPSHIKLTFVKYWMVFVMFVISVINISNSIIFKKVLDLNVYVVFAIVICLMDAFYLKNMLRALKYISIKWWLAIVVSAFIFGLAGSIVHSSFDLSFNWFSNMGPYVFVICVLVVNFFRSYSNEYIFRALFKRFIDEKWWKVIYFLIQFFSPSILFLISIALYTNANDVYVLLKILLQIFFVITLVFLERKSKNSELNFAFHFISITIESLSLMFYITL